MIIRHCQLFMLPLLMGMVAPAAMAQSADASSPIYDVDQWQRHKSAWMDQCLARVVTTPTSRKKAAIDAAQARARAYCDNYFQIYQRDYDRAITAARAAAAQVTPAPVPVASPAPRFIEVQVEEEWVPPTTVRRNGKLVRVPGYWREVKE